MNYTAAHSTFDLSAYINHVVAKLPEGQQTDELRKTIEVHVVRVIMESIRNFMSYEDLMDLMEKVESNNEKANEIMVEYINNNSELQTQLNEELDHFESLTAKFN